MHERVLEGLFGSMLLVAGSALAGVGCSSQSPVGGCSSDADCRRGRICVDGVCRFPGASDTAGADVDTPENFDSVSETDAEAGDTSPITDPETGPPRDATPDSETGPSRSLSCHEFATCQGLACERFDFSCKEQFSSRTSETQLDQLDARQNCMGENCAGLQGVERTQCAVENCESEWQACGERPGSGDQLDCAEFQNCTNLCNGRENRESCRADCQSRATESARRSLRNYQICIEENCGETSGRDFLRCIRENCLPELSACWKC